MRDVFIVGVHTTKFARCPERGIKDLTAETVQGVLRDAQLERGALQSAFFSNAAWGLNGYQHCIRGQVALRPIGIDAIPITNVENACASGSTALHGAWKDVAGGFVDVALAVGAEKIFQKNRFAMFAGFLAGTDVESAAGEAERFVGEGADTGQGTGQGKGTGQGQGKGKGAGSVRQRVRGVRDQVVVGIQLGESIGYGQLRRLVSLGAGKGGGQHSPFMEIYAYKARQHMARYGSTVEQLATIASKNHHHSTMNPNAQYSFELSVEQVLQDRAVAPPLTRAMCAPVGDGAAAVIVMSEQAARRYGLMSRAVRIRASVLGSGRQRGADEPDIGERLAQRAYALAGAGPGAVDCVELHDATAFGELHQTEALGLFPKGDGGPAAERGDTRIGGRLPVNPSGGLLSRGHPIGASGLAQVHELVTQLRGEAGARQVASARIGLAENGGGALGDEEAAMCVHILEAPARGA